MQSRSGAGMLGDRKDMAEKTVLEESYMGGFLVNSPDSMVLDQSINHTWKNLKYGSLNEEFQKRKPSGRTSGGCINDVHSSWYERKIDHISCFKSLRRKRGRQHFSFQM